MVKVIVEQRQIVDDPVFARRRLRCFARVEGAEFAGSWVEVPLLAIFDRMERYRLATPQEALRAVFREHATMWCGLGEPGGGVPVGLRRDVEVVGIDDDPVGSG